MYHKICHFSHFSVYTSVSLSTFTLLCNHYHHPSPERFSLCKMEPLFPILPSPQPPAVVDLLSLYMVLPVPVISHKWNHAVRGLFCI